MLMGRRELERGRVGRDVTSFISSVWLALMALVCLGRGGLMTQVDWDLRENEKKGPQKNASKGGDPSSSTWCYFPLAIIIFTVYPQLFFFFFFCSTAVYFRRNLHESYIVVCVLVPTPGAAQVEPQSTSLPRGLLQRTAKLVVIFAPVYIAPSTSSLPLMKGRRDWRGLSVAFDRYTGAGSQWTARALSCVCVYI
jgi:hypothetical protein